MKKYKRTGIFVIIMCMMLITLGCNGGKNPSVGQSEIVSSTTDIGVSQPETGASSSEVTVNQPESTVSESKINSVDQGTGENLTFARFVWTFDEAKMAKASEKGFESPFAVIEKSDYKPSLEDTIQYDPNLSDEALYQSMTYKGIKGIEIVYDIDKLTWNDFFGDLDYSQYESVKTVSLKGDSLYEAEIVDDYEKYFRYYDENEGVYYEVSELMLGNFTDPNAVLTKKSMGNSCFYKGISSLIAPTYNPFVLDQNEQVLSCQNTTLNDEPVIYIEKEKEGQLYEAWVSVKDGVVVKQLIFDGEGLLKRRSIATSVETKSIDEAVFYKPNDIEFRDITLFVFSMTGGDTKTLAGAVENTISKESHSMTLQSNTGEKRIIHSGGLNEMALDRPLYLTINKSMNGDERTVIQYRNEDDFYTLCPELKMAELYEKSCYEMRFFDFEKVGLYNVTEVNNLKSYVFYDSHVDSVSGMIRFYEYVIDKVQNKIVVVKVYSKESLTDDVIAGEVSDYKIEEIGEVNEKLYEIPSDYKIIDHGDNSNNDGENMPFWYQ